MKQPLINVGIQIKSTIEFLLSGNYTLDNGEILSGKWKASITGEKISLENEDSLLTINSGAIISPKEPSNDFTLFNVTIGINFHWQRDENQTFNGSLKLILDNNKIIAVNVINIEDYLTSVISSEMSANSSSELLKAHAVISRSWLIAQLNKNNSITNQKDQYNSCISTDNELVKWYDREDHENFDVCADDHCQRYQGITRKTSAKVEQAVKETFGEVLVYAGEICDARFSKCCGGITEAFENVWEPTPHPYLIKVIDNKHVSEVYNIDLESNDDAEKWICSTPDAYCNTNDKEVLQQVLNDYDQETNDYYRWRVEYEQKELSELVKRRLGIDFGLIKSLEALERGVSGRIKRLKIVGEKRTYIIGKELEIRKALSETHLYSSAFVVSKEIDNTNKVKFILAGAGWGHGVGLCQIGAAVMGQLGFKYDEILKHYFKNISLEKKYNS